MLDIQKFSAFPEVLGQAIFSVKAGNLFNPKVSMLTISMGLQQISVKPRIPLKMIPVNPKSSVELKYTFLNHPFIHYVQRSTISTFRRPDCLLWYGVVIHRVLSFLFLALLSFLLSFFRHKLASLLIQG